MLATLMDKDIIRGIWSDFYDKKGDGLHVDRLADFLLECIKIQGDRRIPKVVIDTQNDSKLLESYVEMLVEAVEEKVNIDGNEWITCDEMLAYHREDERLVKEAEGMGMEEVFDMLAGIAVEEIWKLYDLDSSDEIDL